MRRKLSLLVITVIVIAPLSFFITRTQAAGLTNIVVTPVSQNQSTATNVAVVFTPVTTITTGSIIEITYDTAFTGGASLVDADVSVAGTNITSTVESGFVAGYFKSTLTTSAGVTTPITITIGATNKLTTPSSAGNYSWSVSVNIGGAGTTYDTGAGLSYISSISIKENQVQVSAIVPPTLALDLDQTGSNTKLVDPNSCSLGVLSLNSVKTCSYDVAVGTNNSAGATVKVNSNGGLTNGSHSFTGTGGSPASAATEGYGFWISTAGSAFTAAGSYATQSQNVPAVETSFAASAAVSSTTTIGEHFTVTHEAAMSTATPTGAYTQVVTYTAYTN